MNIDFALVNPGHPHKAEMQASGLTVATIDTLNDAIARNDAQIQIAYTASKSSIRQNPFEITGARLLDDGSVEASVQFNLTFLFPGFLGKRKDDVTGQWMDSFRYARAIVKISPTNAAYPELKAYAEDLVRLGATFNANGSIALNNTRGQGLYQLVMELGDDAYDYFLFSIEERDGVSLDISPDGKSYAITACTLNGVKFTRKTAGAQRIEEQEAVWGRPKTVIAPSNPVASKIQSPVRTTTVAPVAPPAPNTDLFV